MVINGPGAMAPNAEMFRLLLESTGDGIYGTDMAGNCTFANPACLRLLGFEREEDLLGRHVHTLAHHKRADGSPYPVEECQIYQAFTHGWGVHVEDEVMWRTDGSSFAAEYWSYPVIKDGEIVGCVVSFSDITERVLTQNALQEREAEVSAILMSAGEAVYGTDLAGNCTFANPACVELLGAGSEADLLGEHMHNLVHHTRLDGSAYPVQECQIYRAFMAGEPAHVDNEVMFKLDGTRFFAEYRSHPLFRDGVVSGCVVTFTDITQRLEIEEELRQAEKMAAIGTLSAGLAHELNNPAAAATRASAQMTDTLRELQQATLNAVATGLTADAWDSLLGWDREAHQRAEEPLDLSPLQASDREEEIIAWLDARGVDDPWDLASTLVAMRFSDDDLGRLAMEMPGPALGPALTWLCRSFAAQDLIEGVLRSTGAISALVNAAKSFTYLDQAPVQEVDIHQGIEDTLTMLGGRVQRGIEVVAQFDRNLPRIEVPASELNQVWINLIDNAMDAAGDGGKISIKTFSDAENLVVEITDNGPGIPEELQSRIFDPFFTTKPVGEGVGLGLDIARRVVTTRCHGDLGFRCGDGETTFWVQLPLSAGPGS